MNTRATISKLYNAPITVVLVSFGVLLTLVIAQFSGSKYGHHIEGAIIVGMGAWRVFAEKNPYQRFRVGFIVVGVSLAWFVIPALGITFFPSIHVVGSIAFFLFLIPVILFGRGADCGWFCPCVATRETAGYAFRGVTPRGKIWWHLRHLKWPATIVAIAIFPVSIFAGDLLGDLEGPFQAYIFYGYFGSFLLLPVLGNRNFCRFGCPYGAIWGMVGKYGFFRIQSNVDACISCKKCDKVCDMGIPLSDYTNKKSTIRTMECMGCGRCVTACPQGVLDLRDVRGFRKIPKKTKTESQLSI